MTDLQSYRFLNTRIITQEQLDDAGMTVEQAHQLGFTLWEELNWICAECGQINKPDATICKGCKRDISKTKYREPWKPGPTETK